MIIISYPVTNLVHHKPFLPSFVVAVFVTAHQRQSVLSLNGGKSCYYTSNVLILLHYFVDSKAKLLITPQVTAGGLWTNGL